MYDVCFVSLRSDRKKEVIEEKLKSERRKKEIKEIEEKYEKEEREKMALEMYEKWLVCGLNLYFFTFTRSRLYSHYVLK